MDEIVKYNSASGDTIQSLGSMIPSQLEDETLHASAKLIEALGGDVTGFVANRLQMSPEELPIALAAEQVDGVALAIYNIEARSQSVIIGDQTGIGKGRQAAAMIRYGILAGYLPIFLTDRYTLSSDMYRDCKALGIKDARPLIVNTRVSIVDFEKPIEDNDEIPSDEIWTPEEDSDEEEIAGLYVKHYEEVYKSPKKSELELMYGNGDIPENCFEYVMLTYSQLKDARKDMTRLDFQLVSQETFTDRKGVTRNIRFEECTGRIRQLEYLSPEGDDEYFNVSVLPREKRHSNHIYNDFQNNKLDVILINACGAIGASAHAVATVEVPENEVRQRKMLIVQNDLDVNIDLQKRGRINRTGQIVGLPPLYEYIITSIPSEKRLNMMLRAKLRSLSANTTANQDQDKRQADFIDITNKYGNIVAYEFLQANSDLAFVLGLKPKTTASRLLARLAMLSVAAQQEIIDDLLGAYQNLEQELRRINQWDLEREYRDFDAKFVRDELFTAPIDDAALGGASMLTTFQCRHRTYPYNSASLLQCFELAETSPYGRKLSESKDLHKEIEAYYRAERKAIRDRLAARKEKLYTTTLLVLLKYGIEENEARQLLLMAQRPESLWDSRFYNTLKGLKQEQRITNKLKNFNKDYEDLEAIEKKELGAKSAQRKRLMEVISLAEIGQGYNNIISAVPVEEGVDRIMAVLKEVRFGKSPRKCFLPGQVQFVFALSAVHKELVLNLVDKGSLSKSL